MLAALLLSVFATVSSPASISASVVDSRLSRTVSYRGARFSAREWWRFSDDVRDRFKLEAGNGVYDR